MTTTTDTTATAAPSPEALEEATYRASFFSSYSDETRAILVGDLARRLDDLEHMDETSITRALQQALMAL